MESFQDTGELFKGTIISIEEVDSESEYVYDIEVEDNHNYFADSILVSNSSNNTMFDFNLSHLNSFYFRHGLTATNFTSSDDSSILLEAVLSNTVYSMSILEAIQKKYIVPIMPVFFDIPNTHLVSEGTKYDEGSNKKPNAAAIYKKDYKTFIDINEDRNQIILNLIEKMIKQEVPALTLVKHIQHGRDLCGTNSIFLNGQDASARENQEQIKRFNSLEIPSIVGTSVIGEGVDSKACGAIINGKGGKNKRELLQNIGRCVRNFPGKTIGFYFDFIDRRQKSLYAHSKERMKIIKQEFGVEPKIIKV